MSGPKVTRDMINRSLTELQTKGPEEHPLVSRVLESGFDDEHFYVGDDVITNCGSIAGVIVSITGNKALVSWACRGKTVEPLEHLVHVEHDV